MAGIAIRFLSLSRCYAAVPKLSEVLPRENNSRFNCWFTVFEVKTFCIYLEEDMSAYCLSILQKYNQQILKASQLFRYQSPCQICNCYFQISVSLTQSLTARDPAVDVRGVFHSSSPDSSVAQLTWLCLLSFPPMPLISFVTTSSLSSHLHRCSHRGWRRISVRSACQWLTGVWGWWTRYWAA